MTIQEHVPLASLTTLRVGGPASYVATCTSVEDVREALVFAKEHSLPYYVLGGGSNVLAPDEGYKGVMILVRLLGLEYIDEGTRVLMKSSAGESWDAVVEEAAARGLWGIENLAGIPGTIGAAPIQNIGAYGAELKDTLDSVEVLDADTGEVRTLSVEECELAYRDSRFKREPHLIVTKVTLALQKNGTPKIEYKDLLKAQEQGADLSSPAAIGKVVREVRGDKFPDLRTTGTAGSFFKNPILTSEKYAALKELYGEVPSFPHPHGIKIPLAFVLDRVLNLRGFRQGPAWLFGSQPLVLALDREGRAEDVESLARLVEQKVFDATGITIEREVRSMPHA
ncbi:UDP-N-acetylmuramate dehydrogenase [Patescibacteria group bacterium]|nr:UDP-N-acetylmuramate dehydrogenase [Patescibacteria group bacterium]